MPSFHIISRMSTPELFFDLKDKKYKKAKIEVGLGWVKNIGNDPARFLMGTIFLVILNDVLNTRCSDASLPRNCFH